MLAALRAEFAENTLILASGDNYIPDPFSPPARDPAAPFNGIKGRADITILNALGIQASCFGNHEFDDNTPQVRNLILTDAVSGLHRHGISVPQRELELWPGQQSGKPGGGRMAAPLP